MLRVELRPLVQDQLARGALIAGVRLRLRHQRVEGVRLEVVELWEYLEHPILLREVEVSRFLEDRIQLLLQLRRNVWHDARA